MNSKKVTILMCTYNAKSYIEEQLISLLKQTYEYIEIVIYDDASTDNTIEIIEEIAERYNAKNKIRIVPNLEGNRGAKSNFKKIISDYRNEEYVCFCDQDDIWELNKVEILMDKMIELESGRMKPYLICHNCYITDEQGNIYDKRDIGDVDFYELILNPQIQGCCMMLNYSALSLVWLEQHDFYMHDWYASLLISIKGHIEIIDEYLLKYRQHETNQIGYKKLSFRERFKKIINYKEKMHNYAQVLLQLKTVATKCEDNEFLSEYLELYNIGKSSEIIKLFFKYNVLKKNIQGYYQAFIVKKAFDKEIY